MVHETDTDTPSGSGTLSGSAAPSGSGTSTPASQNRPIVMPESFAALENEEWNSWKSTGENCHISPFFAETRQLSYFEAVLDL